MTHNDTIIGRRPVLKGAGMTLAGLTGLTGSAAAKGGNGKGKGGKTPLSDRQADVLVYFSTPYAGDGDANQAEEYGFPATSVQDVPGGTHGLFVGTNDPAGGGQFDFGKIEMTPNGGTLHNTLLFFQGALLASKPKPYVLVHEGGGLYESRGQVMNFEAREVEEMPPAFKPSPPAQILGGGTWRAVGTDVARLGLDDNGRPDPTMPEWGITRIDFYTPDSEQFVLSLLYAVVANDNPNNPLEGLQSTPEAYGVTTSLIQGGLLNPGGQ